MLKARPTRAPKKAPVKNRRAAAPRVKPTHVISLSAADSRKLAAYLSAPAREPNDFMKDALADYRRLLGTK